MDSIKCVFTNFEVEVEENILFLSVCSGVGVLTQCCAGQPHDVLQPPPGGQAGAAHPDLGDLQQPPGSHHRRLTRGCLHLHTLQLWRFKILALTPSDGVFISS